MLSFVVSIFCCTFLFSVVSSIHENKSNYRYKLNTWTLKCSNQGFPALSFRTQRPHRSNWQIEKEGWLQSGLQKKRLKKHSWYELCLKSFIIYLALEVNINTYLMSFQLSMPPWLFREETSVLVSQVLNPDPPQSTSGNICKGWIFSKMKYSVWRWDHVRKSVLFFFYMLNRLDR